MFDSSSVGVTLWQGSCEIVGGFAAVGNLQGTGAAVGGLQKPSQTP